MPPHSDVFERLRQATVAIVDGLAAVQAITGRASANCVAWDSVGEAARPVVVYKIIVLGQNGESGDGREGVVQFTAVAENNNADRTVNELLKAIEDGYTASALYAQGVDGAPMLLVRRGGDDEADGEDAPRDLSRNTHYAHLDAQITLTHS
jgi:hypothetical protein